MTATNVGSPYVRPVQIGSATLGGGLPWVLVAGLALDDGERGGDDVFALAQRLAALTREWDVAAIFRIAPVNDPIRKAGGFTAILCLLREIRTRLGLPVAIDVHRPQQVAEAIEVADLLRVAACECGRTDLLIEAAHSGRPVDIEIDSSVTPQQAGALVDRVLSTGNWNVALTDCRPNRDSRPVVAAQEVTRLRETGFPLVVDVGPTRGGIADRRAERRTADEMAAAALIAGVDGISLVVRTDDQSSGYPVTALPDLLDRLRRVEQAARPTS